MYDWTISLGSYYHLPNSKSQKQEEIEPLTIFLGLGPAPVLPSLSSPSQNKKKGKEEKRRKKEASVKKEAGLEKG